MPLANMKDHLNGMFWASGAASFPIPDMGTRENAVRVFKTSLASITWNCMSTLERNPATLPQTETILKGQSVGGISIDQLLQVKNYGEGAKKLCALLLNDRFSLDQETACLLHACAGREDALEWGVFRRSEIAIGGVSWRPPHFSELPQLARRGFAFLSEHMALGEAAVALFLFMARSQFFYDANKRTASLMMNGLLMRQGLHPITVLNRDSEEFHDRLARFYETGDATDMMRFFAGTVAALFPNPHDFEPALQRRSGGVSV